jgi:hypothetical protein
MKTKTHFAFRVDVWDEGGNSIVEHIAGIDDLEVAEATYRAAVARWPRARITLRRVRGSFMRGRPDRNPAAQQSPGD